MSICMCARINKRCIDAVTLGKYLTDFFVPMKDIITVQEKHCISYENVWEDNKVEIAFVSEEKPPYNVWDSIVYAGEWKYSQLVIFYIQKDEACVSTYKRIIDFCLYLKRNVDSDILVTSEIHNDMCLIKASEVIGSEEIEWMKNYKSS